MRRRPSRGWSGLRTWWPGMSGWVSGAWTGCISTAMSPSCRVPAGVVWFFHDHRGKPTVSPALFEPIGEGFRREVKAWAQANGVPLIRFAAGQRKAEVMGPYLAAAAGA
jgi:hypothetical protein